MFSDFTSVATPLYEVQHTYVCGLYRILSEITARFPNVLFELCASGGARFDLGMLCFMPIGWVSDNTDVLSRALIQEGTSYGYPISVMCNHISAVPNHQTKRISTLETRNGIASFGVLGLQYDLTKLPKEELVYLKNCIAELNCTPIVRQYGILYNKWGVLLCQKECQTNGIHRNSRKWL